MARQLSNDLGQKNDRDRLNQFATISSANEMYKAEQGFARVLLMNMGGRTMYKKKLLSIMMASAMVMTSITGCGSSKADASGDASVAANSDNSTEDSNGEYPVIKVAYTTAQDTVDEPLIEEELNKIMREKANAEVDLVSISFGDWSTQLNLLLTGNNEDSIDLFDSFWYTPLANLVANGQIMDITEYMDDEGKGIKELYSGDMEAYLKCGQINGKQYGIPGMYAFCNENFYYCDAETAENANIDWDTVNDVDSMSDTILKLKEANPDKYFVPGSTELYWFPKNIDNLGDSKYLGVLMDPTESTVVSNYYESDDFVNMLNHVKEWKEAGAISPDPLSNNNPTINNLALGVAAGTPGYGWDTDINTATTNVQQALNLVGHAVSKPLSTTSDVTTFMWHVSAFCKNPEAAMRVLNVLYTDADASMLVSNGIEGKHYVINENGQMEYPEGVNNLMEMGWNASSLAYWPNVMLDKSWNYEPADIYEKMQQKNKECDRSLALGFAFDSTNVADQITACTNVVSQYYVPLMYGEVDIESTLSGFQQALKDAGIDEIIAEKQAQLDKWLAENN